MLRKRPRHRVSDRRGRFGRDLVPVSSTAARHEPGRVCRNGRAGEGGKRWHLVGRDPETFRVPASKQTSCPRPLVTRWSRNCGARFLSAESREARSRSRRRSISEPLGDEIVRRSGGLKATSAHVFLSMGCSECSFAWRRLTAKPARNKFPRLRLPRAANLPRSGLLRSAAALRVPCTLPPCFVNDHRNPKRGTLP